MKKHEDQMLICIPIFNDWASAEQLLKWIDRIVTDYDISASVLFVDDGSTEQSNLATATRVGGLKNVSILRLRRNVGHQRAIAIGLTYIYENCPCRSVIVMDGDGEDAPDDIVRLLERFNKKQEEEIIFAKRTRRAEGLIFRFFYILFKVVHRVLTGRKVEVGNFSIIPTKLLKQIVGISEIWNHYSAAIFKARLKTDKLPIARTRRLQSQSKMGFVSLVTHGLSAISVYGEEVGVRLLFATGLLIVLSLSGLAVVAGIHLFAPIDIPGWATTAAGLLLITLLNAFALSMVFIFIVLQARNNSTFLPLRDYNYYVGEIIKIV